MSRLIIASKNDGKIREITAILKPFGIKVVTYKKFSDWPQLPEVDSSYAENALMKAKTISNYFNLPALADDSGLEVDFLEGRPGPISSRYAGENANSQQNIEKLLLEMKNCPEDRRTAKFKAVACLAFPGNKICIATGICSGRISYNPSGEDGFGYDPIFIPLGFDRSMAELSLAQKNEISHRAKSVRLVYKISRL
ncbi:MAG: RdgB/HAM1 family non-canonical purine NTP pyrophosphatase [Actinobacteria bacterium]|nr:RdgB/HAM1 family non-canonical purine NTP pyrophosphatase [Actinomycetota bacterium]